MKTIRRPLLLGALLATICLTTMGQGIVQNIITTAYTRIFLRATNAAQALAILGITNAAPMNAASGYILKYDGTSITNSSMFQVGGSIGIGTVAPSDVFHVAPAASGGTNIRIQSRPAFGATHSSQQLVLGHSVRADTNAIDQMVVTETNSGQGAPAAIRMGTGRIEFHTATSGTSGVAFDSERVRISNGGNVGIGITAFGTSAAKTLGLGSGTAPTTFPADMVQIMAKDQNGTAGNAALHIYPEAGATNIIGKWVQFPGGLLVGGTVTTDPAGKLRVGTGLVNDGGGFKHARLTTGSINAASSAIVTNSWTTAFADANYTLTASVQDSTTALLSLRVVHIEALTATGVAVRVENSSAGALTGTLHLNAIHD